MVFDTPVVIRPIGSEDAVSVDDPAYAALVEAWKADIPQLMGAVGMDTAPLPLVWSADFAVIEAPAAEEGEEAGPSSYTVTAFDVGCVGMSGQLEVVPAVADAAIAISGAAPAADDEGGAE